MMVSKLKAGSLQLTMFILVVIALLLASFVVLLQTHRRFNLQTDFVLETINNSQKGIDYALHNPITLNEINSIDLNDEDYKTLSVKRDYWGMFEKVTSISKIKTNAFTKAALVGAVQSKTNRTALYIKDNNKPLVLVGNTKIQGTVYLPKQGIRPGNISGKSYYGSQLIYGKTQLSRAFPKLLPETLEHIKALSVNETHFKQDQFLDLDKNKVHQNSFLKPLQVIYSNTDITLSEVNLTGHIRIQSKTKIVVEAIATLKDVVLIAPEIEIKNNVEGRFQAFATTQLTVGENCKLNYPSALVLNENEITIENNDSIKSLNQRITIDKETTINGVVVFLGRFKSNNYKPQILIEENVSIKGEVYCEQNLELKGSVLGSVFTNNFIATASGSIYQNHIYNGTIIVNDLPQEYIGLSFENTKKGVLQWLY
jgi:hypothetical protein